MMTIGQVLAELRKAKPGASVKFDFCGLMPTRVHSDRGYYDHAALGWAASEYWAGRGGLKYEDYPTVASLIKVLEDAIQPHVTFSGWKGGEYSYDEDTPLHIDNYGESNQTELVSVEDCDWRVLLHTVSEDQP